MSPLNWPQTIELAPGEAGHFYGAVALVWRAAHQATLAEPPKPLDAGLLLALPVLQRLGKRLYRVYQAEQRQVGKPRRTPRPFRLSCEDVAAVMRHVWPAAADYPAAVLGKVQQKSLNLASYVQF